MTLSPSLKAHPQIDSWLQFHSDGKLTVFSGKAELGQKLKTAFGVIAAEELDMDIRRITVRTAETGVTPNEKFTAGSNSMEESGTAIRQAAAEARRILFEMASEHLGEPTDNLIVSDGEISGRANDRAVTYQDLMGGKSFDRQVSDETTPKDPGLYRLIGKPVPADGFEDIVCGVSEFVHDMELPAMLHGRVVRPPNYNARLLSVDVTKVKSMQGVTQVIRDGSFLAVACEREEQAVWAAAKLKSLAQWDSGSVLNSSADIFELLKTNGRQSLPVVDGVPLASAVPDRAPPASATATLSATYLRPYHMHASIGPSAAMAHYEDTGLNIWSHSQGVYPLRAALAAVLEVEEEFIHVTHVAGPGCYGHNGADDVALDAALVARATPGRPVLMKWERDDEHAWEPYGPAMRVEMQASLDEHGQVLHWCHDSYSDTHSGRPGNQVGHSRLLAAWHLQNPLKAPVPKPSMAYHGGIHRNADPIYEFADKRIVKHLVGDLPLRVSALRALGNYANIFALESFMDELAEHHGQDPLAFRLAHLEDKRARAVLEAAADAANWRSGPRTGGHGQGLAFARYKNEKCFAAVIIDLKVDDYGHIQLERAIIAADAGQVVDPQGLCSQLEGGLIQSASWTLKEQVTFDAGGITSRDWESYPIFDFGDVPTIETVLLDRPDQPFLGAGEATQGPTAAAIGNALFDATQVRLRRLPMTPENVREAAASS
jgi:CO/xanthine dehydrogenase Mo-binding subunit